MTPGLQEKRTTELIAVAIEFDARVSSPVASSGTRLCLMLTVSEKIIRRSR